MNHHQEIERIIEQAKQQRAEFIGAALKNNALPIALVAALALVAVQFANEAPVEHSGNHPAQLTTAGV